MIDNVIEQAIRLGASDIHITENKVVLYRVLGELRSAENFVFANKDIDEILQRFCKGISRQELTEQGYDFSFTHSERRLRGHVALGMSGVSIYLRLLNDKIATIDELGLPDTLYDIARANDGLFLVTGPTGSGKSTSLAAIVEEINMNRRLNVITIEDPIEYIYQEKMARIEQREVGEHVSDFSSAVRETLRQDPDVVLVGELRDYETIDNALILAETGHLVLGTLHARSVVETIERMISVFPESRRDEAHLSIINVLRGVMYQRLVNTKDFKRTPICEVMILNDPIRSLLKDKKSKNTVRDAIRSEKTKGNIHMVDYSIDLYRKGIVDIKELEKELDPDDFEFFKKVNRL